MNKVKYDIDEYSHSDLCDMFKIEKTKNIDSTILNKKYNQMLTEIKVERGISEKEKQTLYVFLEQEPGPAMVLRVEQMLLTCCSSVSFVSKGKFNSFCLWFADKFDTDTEDWKPNFESGSTTRCSRCKAF